MVKRLLSVAVALLGVAFLVPAHSSADGGRPFTYDGPVILPTTGSLFGAFVELDFHNGMERRQAQLDFEALAGRKMAIDRQYYLWDENWPTSDDYWTRDQGRIPYLSWSAYPGGGGSCRKWADIAAGVYDADIHAQATKVKAFASPFFFAFHHEPMTGNQNESCGMPTDFINAWRHIHDLWVADGVTNVTWSWTVTAWSFLQGTAGNFYPGDDVVDVIGADGYNWFGCTFHPGPWREPIQVFQQFHDFGAAHQKPMVIAEYGTGEDPAIPERKGQWFTNLADLLKIWTDVKGIAQFNVGNGSCNRWIDTSDTSLDAFQTNGADPYFNPPTATVPVTAGDGGFTPKTARPARGTGVQWTGGGANSHRITDASGMGLFDSGTLGPGATYTFYFIASGSYQYEDALNPSLKGTVKVPVSASPRSGGIDTTFTITWAANHPPTSDAFDIQIRRPGSNLWQNWLTGETDLSGSFVPDSGTGTYFFRARYRNLTLAKASKWSDTASITVS